MPMMGWCIAELNAPQNLPLLRKIVLDLIRADKTDRAKTSLRLKRKWAVWDGDIRTKMQGGQFIFWANAEALAAMQLIVIKILNP